MNTNERDQLINGVLGKRYDDKILEKLTKLNHYRINFLPLNNDLNLRKSLDTGAFGIVDLVRYKTKLYAHKRALNNNHTQYHNILDEAIKLSEISGSHPNIQQIHFINIKSFGFLMDYCDCGSLEKFIKDPSSTYTLRDVLSWSYQLADALNFLHSKNLMHRDVKLQNILLKDNYQTLVLTDYGTATNLGRSLLTKQAGTPITMAPEVCDSTYYTEQCDIYSWAIVFWQLLSKESSPYDQNINCFTLMFQVSVKKLRPSQLSSCPKLILALLYRSWHSNPKERPSLSFIKLFLRFILSYFPFEYSSTETHSNLSNRLQNYSPCTPRLHNQRSRNLYDEHRKKLDNLSQLEQNIDLKEKKLLFYREQNETKYDHYDQLNKENQILQERIRQIKSHKQQ